MSEIERITTELDRIRNRRDERDYWVLSQTLVGAAKNLRDAFRRWITSELNDLRDEIGLLRPFSRGAASERLSGYSTEIGDIDKEKLKGIIQELDSFIKAVEDKEMKSSEDVATAFGNKILPAVSMIFRLMTMRETLDSMIDMLPTSEDSS